VFADSPAALAANKAAALPATKLLDVTPVPVFHDGAFDDNSGTTGPARR